MGSGEGWGLADVQIYTALSYDRLVERCLREAWPAPLWVIGAGLALLVLLVRRPAWAARALAAVAALACAAVAARWLPHCYAELHWISPTLAGGYALQALLLAAAAAAPRAGLAAPSDLRLRAALLLFAAALLAVPLLGLPPGASLWRAEWLGLMPAPGLAACLAVLPLLTLRWRLLLLPAPLAGIAFESLTLASIGRGSALLLPLLAVATAVLIVAAGRHERRLAPR